MVWIKAKNNLPPIGKRVVVYAPTDCNVPFFASLEKGDNGGFVWSCYDSDLELSIVTHWYDVGEPFEEGVPITSPKVESIYRFDTMEVGQSLFVENASMSAINGAAKHYRTKNNGENINKKFTCRKAMKNMRPGVRYWRIE